MKDRYYTFYITTNATRKVLYCGVTNDLLQRVVEHYLTRGNSKTFTGRYHCYWLVYYEDFQYITDAIDREKQVKGWNRQRKEILISAENPGWKFWNFELFEQWPPGMACHRKDI